jgi:hypothetical protein
MALLKRARPRSANNQSLGIGTQRGYSASQLWISERANAALVGCGRARVWGVSLVPPVARHGLFGLIGTFRFAVKFGGLGFRGFL